MCIPLAQKRLYPSPCLLMFLRDCKCQEPRFSAPRSYLATVPPQIDCYEKKHHIYVGGNISSASENMRNCHFTNIQTTSGLFFWQNLKKHSGQLTCWNRKTWKFGTWFSSWQLGEFFPLPGWNFRVFCIKSSNRNTFLLVGGLSNPFERYERQIGSFPPGFGGEHKKSVKPSPSLGILFPWSSATNSPNPRNLHPPEHPKVTNLGHRVQLSIQREAFDHACRDVYGGWWLVVGGWTNPFNKNMGQSNWSKSPQIFGVEHIWVAST